MRFKEQVLNRSRSETAIVNGREIKRTTGTYNRQDPTAFVEYKLGDGYLLHASWGWELSKNGKRIKYSENKEDLNDELGKLGLSIEAIEDAFSEIDAAYEEDPYGYEKYYESKENRMKLTMNDLRNLIKEEIQLLEMAIKNKSFCVTGTLSIPRSRFFDLVEENGGIVHKAVGRDTDYLVIGAGIGRNKISKAEALGVTVIDEKEFLHMMRGGRRSKKDVPVAWRGTSGRGVGEYRRDRRYEEVRRFVRSVINEEQ